MVIESEKVECGFQLFRQRTDRVGMLSSLEVVLRQMLEIQVIRGDTATERCLRWWKREFGAEVPGSSTEPGHDGSSRWKFKTVDNKFRDGFRAQDGGGKSIV